MKKLLFAAVAATAFGVYAEETATGTVPAGEKEAAEAAESENESGVWFEAGVDVLSDYMWRGVILDDNWCWQPSVSIGYNTEDFGGIYFNYWASFDLTHRRNNCWGGGNSRQFMSIQEQDFYVGYTKSFGDVDFEIGWYWYDYPFNGGSHKAGSLGYDLYAGVFYNNAFITPGVELLWSPTTQHGHEPATAYVRLSAKHEFAVTDALKVTPKATMGVGNVAYVQNNTGMSDAETLVTDQTCTLQASYAITEWCSISASANYTWIPSHALRKERYMTCGHDSRSQLVWGGVNLTFSF